MGFQHSIVEEMPLAQFQQYYIWPLANCPERCPDKIRTPLAYHLCPKLGTNIKSRTLVRRVSHKMVNMYKRIIQRVEDFIVSPLRCNDPIVCKYFVWTNKIMELTSLMNLGTTGDFDSFAEQVFLAFLKYKQHKETNNTKKHRSAWMPCSSG